MLCDIHDRLMSIADKELSQNCHVWASIIVALKRHDLEFWRELANENTEVLCLTP